MTFIIKYKASFISLISFLFFSMSFFACDDDKDYIIENLTVEVDSDTVEAFSWTAGIVPGMCVKVEGENKWNAWPQNSIKGYVFEEGYYSKLKIKRRVRINPSEFFGEVPYNDCWLEKVLEKRASESVRNK